MKSIWILLNTEAVGKISGRQEVKVRSWIVFSDTTDLPEDEIDLGYFKLDKIK